MQQSYIACTAEIFLQISINAWCKTRYGTLKIRLKRILFEYRVKLSDYTDLNVEKTPTIMSDTARLTRRKFMGVLIVLSLRTTRHTRELPSRLIATMTEQRVITALENAMLSLRYSAVSTVPFPFVTAG